VVNIKVGRDMTVNYSRIGKSLNAIRHNVMFKEFVRQTFLGRQLMSKSSRRLTNEQLKARLIVFIGVCLAMVFAVSVMGMLYALIFVTQPIGAQAPNDKAFIDILTTLTVFLTGALGSVLASNGLKDKPTSSEKRSEYPSDPTS
jgi:Na+/proline symporter